MTRKEAKTLITHNALLRFEYDGSSVFDGVVTLNFIDQIFDEHGEQLQDKDDEIEKLKAEVKYLQSELDDYEQFSETIASARP